MNPELRSAGSPLDKQGYQWSSEDLAYMSQPRIWNLTAVVSAGWWYDDNIYLSGPGSETDKTGDGYYNLRPSLNFAYGPNSWGLACAVSYDMDFQWYNGGEVDNTFNQSVGLQLSWTGARTRVYVSTAYTAIDGGNVDIGDRVQQNDMYLNSGVSYDLTAKTTLGVTFSTVLLDYSGDFFNSNTYTSGAYVDYKITAKSTVGLGADYAYTEVDGGVNYQTYDLNLRLGWAATSRLAVFSTVGAQYQETTEGDFSQTSPVFTLGINYDIFGNGKTSASINAYRNYNPSAILQNQAYWSNGVAVSFAQHIAGRTQVAIAAGYEFAEYEPTAANIVATRKDNFYYVRPNVTYAICNTLSSSVFYQFSKDDSSGFGSSSFERNTVGVMLNYAY